MGSSLGFSKLLEMVNSREITGVVSNSTDVKPGYVFVCIKGFQKDGHSYAEDAITKGASYVVVERDLGLKQQILVPDSRKALAILAHAYYQDPSYKLKLIGVTGTNGKTSTVFMLHHILDDFGSGLFSTVKTMIGSESLAQDRTTPDVLELDKLLKIMIEDGAEYAIMEVSSHSVVLDRIYGLRFRGGIFTNLTQDHLDFHGTIENYKIAKQEFFNTMGRDSVAVFNLDDPASEFMQANFSGKKVGFGIQKGEVRAKEIVATPTSISYTLAIEDNEWKVVIPIGGEFNVYNSLGVLALLYGMDFDLNYAVNKLKSFPGVPGRFEKVDEGQDFAVIVDYAHTPDGLMNVLSSAKKQCGNDGNLIVVFGCGGDRDRSKRPMMGKEAATWADIIFVTSDNPRTEDAMSIIRDIIPGLEGSKYSVEVDRKTAINLALKAAKPGDIVVIAGKGHEDYQEINGKKYYFDDRVVAREGLKEIVKL